MDNRLENAFLNAMGKKPEWEQVDLQSALKKHGLCSMYPVEARVPSMGCLVRSGLACRAGVASHRRS